MKVAAWASPGISARRRWGASAPTRPAGTVPPPAGAWPSVPRNQYAAGMRPRQDVMRTRIGVMNAHREHRPRHRSRRAGRIRGRPPARNKGGSKTSSFPAPPAVPAGCRAPAPHPSGVSDGPWAGSEGACAGLRPRLANCPCWCETHARCTQSVLEYALLNMVKYHA